MTPPNPVTGISSSVCRDVWHHCWDDAASDVAVRVLFRADWSGHAGSVGHVLRVTVVGHRLCSLIQNSSLAEEKTTDLRVDSLISDPGSRLIRSAIML